MAEEIVLMKGNEDTSVTLSLPNQKYWKLLPNRSRGKQPEWLYCRLKVK